MEPVILRKILRPQVAYYSTARDAGYGVLAPRGWSCFGTYGSAGSTLYVIPHPISGPILDRAEKIGKEPAVVLSVIDADTSGRFAAAHIAARVFPDARAFVERVKREHIDDPYSFKFRPWPRDKIERLSTNIVAYMTPPNALGLGTMYSLPPGPQPIYGLAILHLHPRDDDPNLVKLDIRLPETLRHLFPAITIARLGEERSRRH